MTGCRANAVYGSPWQVRVRPTCPTHLIVAPTGPIEGFVERGVWLQIVAALINVLRFRVTQRRRYDPKKNPSDAFADYLDGYSEAFDFYPVCSRNVFQRDIDALVDEFWQIARDFSASVGDAIVTSEKDWLASKPENKDVEAKGTANDDARSPVKLRG